MVEPYILDKEIQWNMEKDSGCEQTEQGNREITFQNAWTRGGTIPSKLNGLRNISRSQISILPHHIISKLNTIPNIQFQQQQLRIQSNAIWDQTQPTFLRRNNRINPQTNKTTFISQNTELLQLHTSNPSGQIKTQNINNGSNENIGIVRMDNFNRQMRGRTEIDNNISGMDMEFERNEYKNVGREKIKDDISIKRLVQHNIQEQEREDKITSSADRQIELSETSDKRSVSVSNRIRQSENTSVKDRIMGWNNDSKQSSNQGIEMVDKENRVQPTRIVDQQNNNMHVDDRRISIGWEATLVYENQIELIQHDCWNKKEVEMTSNAKEIKAIYYGLLRFEQVFKKMHDQAILIRSDNTTAVYDIKKWKAKESLIDRIKQVFYLVKRLKLQIATIHIPGKLNLTTDSLSRLCRSGDYTLKDGMIQMICKTSNYMPEIDIFATQYNKLINNYATVDLNDLGTHFHNAFNYKWSKVKLYIHPPIPVLGRVLQKMKQDKAQGIVIAPIWPGQSWYTKLKNLSTRFLFLGQANKVLEMGQRMKDKDQKLPPGNVGAFLLDLSQTSEEICQ
ncbi:MAG: hypothetical protein EZS28_022980 [Streblomastix strix]|uniref:Uncharacterized protein n=1 Tax=Streblomastix strix TaxID=222440 RepID=A0A5J4VFZ9_9EUKA|nr:MAG: hypothetical protein EZS28_022980 [Streblomastix strix]